MTISKSKMPNRFGFGFIYDPDFKELSLFVWNRRISIHFEKKLKR